MKNTRCFLAGAAIVAGTFVQAQLFIDISCQGIESGGGSPNLLYQYQLRNPSTSGSIRITYFILGTEDVTAANYSSWTMPVGFSWSVLSSGGVWTDRTKTSHGSIAPNPVAQTAGLVLFTYNSPPGTVPGYEIGPGKLSERFGFNHPSRGEDVEWSTSVGGSVWGGPVAGPLGTFTAGPVHAPSNVPEPATCALLFGFGALGFVACRRGTR